MSANQELSTWKIQHINTPWQWLSAFEDGFWPKKLPIAVRQMIFNNVFDDQVWSGKAVPFIVALRGHKDMYREALDLFFRHPRNTFRLWLLNINRSLKMSKTAAAGIQSLDISVSSLAPKFVSQVFRGGATFTTVELKFCYTKSELEQTLIPWIHLMLRLSPKVHTLKITYPRHFLYPQKQEYYTDYVPGCEFAAKNGLELPRKPTNLLQHIQSAFGVPVSGEVEIVDSQPGWTYSYGPGETPTQFFSQPNREWSYEQVTWTFKADNRGVLVWGFDKE
ncbi:hypothetical protein EG329_008509 [Mollisiaceae sp. DMI_Dod_QoI]|nr:hypothetical protein EG329_008509 [Helotiales sp. DMI_Dod_QoI]